MTRRPDPILRFASAPRRAAWALALLATLLVGTVAHEAHHLSDADCGSRGEASQHFCPCAGMHASVLTVQETSAPRPVLLPGRYETPRAVAARPAEPRTSGPARAPPLG